MPRRRMGGCRRGVFLPSVLGSTMVVVVHLPPRLRSPYRHPLAVVGSPSNYPLGIYLVMMSTIVDFPPPWGRHIRLATLLRVLPLVVRTDSAGLSCWFCLFAIVGLRASNFCLGLTDGSRRFVMFEVNAGKGRY